MRYPHPNVIAGATEFNMCITNRGKPVLQIGAASFLEIRASVVTNWGSYHKLGQPLLQNRTAITNWGKMCYKLGQVLQIRAIITNWNITNGATCCYLTQKTPIYNELMWHFLHL